MPASSECYAMRMLGLAARARALVVGTPLVCKALAAEKKPFAVLLASGVSKNTEKRIVDRTAFYGVPLYRLEADAEALALAIGKRDAAVAAVALTDRELTSAVTKELKQV